MQIRNTLNSCLLLFITVLLNSYYTFAGNSLTVPSKKYSTITHALAKVKSGDTIWVKEGIYKEPIKISSGITLVSQSLFKAVIDGAGSTNAVSMGNKSTLTGFEIKNARIGVYSEGVDNTISKCFIHDNQLSGISCVGHLPMIVDNIISENGGSGIQGWDVRSTISTVNHNTIAYNSNEILGYKVEPQVKIKLLRNNFYLNTELIPLLPSDNFSFDPMFIAAVSKNFMLSKKSKCRKMASDNKDIGARIVY